MIQEHYYKPTPESQALRDNDEGWEDKGITEVLPQHSELIEESDDEEVPEEGNKDKKGKFTFPPTADEAYQAYINIGEILKPRRRDGLGFESPVLDRITHERCEQMKHFCYTYWEMQKDESKRSKWCLASLKTAKYFRKGSYLARNLRNWVHAFIKDPEYIPEHQHKGSAGRSRIDNDNFAQELHSHLQSVGEYCTLDHLIEYVGRPAILAKLGRAKTISKATAERWMKKMNYRWTDQLKGQYADGHERDDVVRYRDHTFLPAMAALEPRM